MKKECPYCGGEYYEEHMFGHVLECGRPEIIPAPYEEMVADVGDGTEEDTWNTEYGDYSIVSYQDIQELSNEAGRSGDIPMCIICDIALMDLGALRRRLEMQAETDEEAERIDNMGDYEILWHEVESSGMGHQLRQLLSDALGQGFPIPDVTLYDVARRGGTWSRERAQEAASERISEVLSTGRAQAEERQPPPTIRTGMIIIQKEPMARSSSPYAANILPQVSRVGEMWIVMNVADENFDGGWLNPVTGETITVRGPETMLVPIPASRRLDLRSYTFYRPDALASLLERGRFEEVRVARYTARGHCVRCDSSSGNRHLFSLSPNRQLDPRGELLCGECSGMNFARYWNLL